MEALLQDLRFGMRSLLKTPQLTAAALACIALGIGATMSVVTLINAALIQQVPFPHADRLVRIWAVVDDATREDLSYPDFLDIQRQATSLEAIEGAFRTRLAVTTDEGTERMRGEAVSSGYFELIGMRAERGRLFSEAEYSPEAEHVMVIGDRFWKTTLGGDPEIVGRTVRARSVYAEPEDPTLTFTVIGVLPPGFVGTVEEDVSDFWIPIEHYTPRFDLLDRNVGLVWTIARLRPDVAVETARTEIETIGQRLASAFPDRPGEFGTRLEAFGENWRSEIRTGLYLLLAASLLLLLIACTNIANLLLARLARREHELGVRQVMGARRRRILRQLLTESLILAVLGGIAGVLLAYWGIRGILAVVSFEIPSYVEIGLDGRLAAATLVVIVFTSLAFGTLPAWLGSRLDVGSHVREAGRGAVSSQRQAFLGRLLVVAEVALTFVLLVGAGLMLRSYDKLTSIDLGYRTDKLLRMGITLNLADFPSPEEWRRFMRQAGEMLNSYPGVRQASVISGILPPWRDYGAELVFEGADESVRGAMSHMIDPHLLPTLDLDVISGRNIQESDDDTVPRVVLLSRSLARLLTGGDNVQDAVGRQIRFVVDDQGQTSQPYAVVGVVEDAMWLGPRGDRPHDYDVYLSAQQVPGNILSMAIHTDVDPRSLINPLRRELGKLAPTSPVHWISTMKEELANQTSDSRFYSLLLATYSLSAVLLAVVGIYGVLSNFVVRRFNELGVRMAFGAGARDILRLILGQGLRTVLFGIGVGIVLAVASLRIMSSLLYGVTAQDPWSFAVVAVGLTLLATLACFLPARRAMAVDPAEALRQE